MGRFGQSILSLIQVHDRYCTRQDLVTELEKKPNESFREYAHKWRDLTAQVQPPMTHKELNKIFVNTLKAPYYDRMIGNTNKNFADMVESREIIENGVKLSKIENTEAKKPNPKRKERETHTISYQRKSYNLSYS